MYKLNKNFNIKKVFVIHLKVYGLQDKTSIFVVNIIVKNVQQLQIIVELVELILAELILPNVTVTQPNF